MDLLQWVRETAGALSPSAPSKGVERYPHRESCPVAIGDIAHLQFGRLTGRAPAADAGVPSSRNCPNPNSGEFGEI